MLLGVIACVLALSSVGISVWSLLRGSDVVKRPDVSELVGQSSKTLLTEYERQFRALETEWVDMYQKFMRLAGRMDRQKALEPAPQPEAPASIVSRNDILRNFRKRGNHVKAGIDSGLPV